MDSNFDFAKSQNGFTVCVCVCGSPDDWRGLRRLAFFAVFLARNWALACAHYAVLDCLPDVQKMVATRRQDSYVIFVPDKFSHMRTSVLSHK